MFERLGAGAEECERLFFPGGVFCKVRELF